MIRIAFFNVGNSIAPSDVDAEDAVGTVFSLDCPQYEVRTPGGTVVHILVNHSLEATARNASAKPRKCAGS